MNSKLFRIVAFCSIFFICSSFIDQEPSGKKLFEEHCVKCHGENGTKGFFGTGKLFKSKMTDVEIFARIEQGKSIMPPFKSKLNELEIKSLVQYVKTFRVQQVNK